ncbi:TPA: helix-turn-helix domain-containing protein [Burkholderia lata]|uniref:helix-turn-helix domain-containing protein n=1 Tax=Burkholderia aenigmatica TaxID=2015348 RepID=UPI0040430FB5
MDATLARPAKLFGKRLVELREAKGWSYEKLALESGLARSNVGKIERDQRKIALTISACWPKR